MTVSCMSIDHDILSARLVSIRYCLAGLCVMQAQVGQDEIVCDAGDGGRGGAE